MGISVYLHKDCRIPVDWGYGWITVKDLPQEGELRLPFFYEEELPEVSFGFRGSQEINKLPKANFKTIKFREKGKIAEKGFITYAPFLNIPSIPLSYRNFYLVYHAKPISELPFADGLAACSLASPYVIKLVPGKRIKFFTTKLGLYPKVMIEFNQAQNIKRDYLLSVQKVKEYMVNRKSPYTMILSYETNLQPLFPFTSLHHNLLNQVVFILNNIASYTITGGFRHLNFRVKAILTHVDPCIKKDEGLIDVLENIIFFSLTKYYVYCNLRLGWVLLFEFEDFQLSDLVKLIPPLNETFKKDIDTEFYEIELSERGIFPVNCGIKLCWIGGVIR